MDRQTLQILQFLPLAGNERGSNEGTRCPITQWNLKLEGGIAIKLGDECFEIVLTNVGRELWIAIAGVLKLPSFVQALLDLKRLGVGHFNLAWKTY